MGIEKIIRKDELAPIVSKGTEDIDFTPIRPEYSETNKDTGKYNLFSEQYFEDPVISGVEKYAMSPTACTIAGIPVIDDF